MWLESSRDSSGAGDTVMRRPVSSPTMPFNKLHVQRAFCTARSANGHLIDNDNRKIRSHRDPGYQSLIKTFFFLIALVGAPFF